MCRSRRELSNEYLLAKIGADTAENEPLEVWRKIILQNIQYYPPVSLCSPRRARGGPVRPAHARETVPLAPPREPPGPTPTGNHSFGTHREMQKTRNPSIPKSNENLG